jgi:hypothetical protein
MKLILLFTFAAVTVFAQTNAVSTNVPATKRPSVHAVTLADVQAGLTTISNRLTALQDSRAKVNADAVAAKNKINLEVQAGQFNASSVDATFHKIENQAATTCGEIDRQIAALKLQDMNIREHYKYLLTPSAK